MKIRDIASKEVYSVSPETCLNAVAAMMKRHGIGILPVCEGDSVVGVLTDRDIVIGCLASSNDSGACTARECMTASPVCVSPDIDADESARIMAREQVRRLPVVESGKLVGMLSLGDIANSLDDASVASTLRAINAPLRAKVPC